jgi:PleD family two-component response regulator
VRHAASHAFNRNLPAVDEAAEAVEAARRRDAAADSADLTDVRVLVVADEPDTLEVICSALNSRGAVVR